MEPTKKYIGGGSYFPLRLKVGATISNRGTIVIDDTSNNYGEVIPCTTTDFADTYGISLGTATYTTTQSGTMVEGVVDVDGNPFAIIQARMSGSSTTGTSMTAYSNTSASAGGTVLTAAVGTNSPVEGTLFCLSGANAGRSRIITSWNSNTDLTVTVPFPFAIAVGDTFLVSPYSRLAAAAGNIQATGTDFLEADASIAAGTGGVVAVTEVIFNTAARSYVQFVLGDHALSVANTL